MKNKTVIIRSHNAGVFFGTLKRKRGNEVLLANARRIWFWDGAVTLSQLAVDGTAKPNECKFAMSVPKMIILDVVEIIPCTEKAKKSLEGVHEWKYEKVN